VWGADYDFDCPLGKFVFNIREVFDLSIKITNPLGGFGQIFVRFPVSHEVLHNVDT
jgi:hypothetical protein